jgi:hypothetical protein
MLVHELVIIDTENIMMVCSCEFDLDIGKFIEGSTAAKMA